MIVYKNIFKPFIDFITSFLALVLLSPVLLLVSILLAIANGGNPFFVQARPGKGGKIFNIIKFKTMTDERNSSGDLLPDSERLTFIGKIIRKTSIDEITQLLNVVKGDMSIVGPRPLLPQYLSIYNTEQNKRHLVKPGITGWAQVNGRNAISWTNKLQLDVWYVEHISFFLDFKILMKTIQKVIISEGINSDNMATTEPFNGIN